MRPRTKKPGARPGLILIDGRGVYAVSAFTRAARRETLREAVFL